MEVLGGGAHQAPGTTNTCEYRCVRGGVQSVNLFFAAILKRKSFDFFEFYKILAHVFGVKMILVQFQVHKYVAS